MLKKIIIPFLFLIGILWSTYPHVFLLLLPLPPVSVIQILTLLAFLIYAAPKHYIPPRLMIMMSAFQVLATILHFLIVSDIEFLKQIIYIIWVNAYLSLIIAFGIKKFLFFYNRIILMVALLGVVAFFLTLILGFDPIIEFTEMDGREGYMIYTTFTNGYVGNVIRYAGVFDEPGAMAGWGMFSLIINRIFVKDSKLEIPLMVALLFTFSLAYILQLFLYLCVFYIGKVSLRKKVFFVLSFILFIFLLYFLLDHSSPVYLKTFGRLGLGDSEGFWVENNRSVMMVVAQKYFYSSPWFGVGNTTLLSGEYAADNPFEILASHGIFGMFFLYLPLLYSLYFAKKDMSVCLCILILVVGYMQRPFHINCLHYTMLYLLCLITYLNSHIRTIKALDKY